MQRYRFKLKPGYGKRLSLREPLLTGQTALEIGVEYSTEYPQDYSRLKKAQSIDAWDSNAAPAPTPAANAEVPDKKEAAKPDEPVPAKPDEKTQKAAKDTKDGVIN